MKLFSSQRITFRIAAGFHNCMSLNDGSLKAVLWCPGGTSVFLTVFAASDF